MNQSKTLHERLDKSLAWAIELVLLVTVTCSPWAFGCVHARFEFWLGVSVCCMAALCGLRAMLHRKRWRFGRTSSLVLVGWTALILVVIGQSVGLPNSVLHSISPTTSTLIAELIPKPLEQIEMGSSNLIVPADLTVGSAASLNPSGSQRFGLRLLGMLIVFFSIATLPNPQHSLRRLSIVAIVVGTGLAIFAIAQSFGESRQTMYWFFSLETDQHFGPFINKNHFPFFINLALGLSVGLLLERVNSNRLGWASSVLHDVRTLWLLAGIAFMLASVVLSGSRGGVVALAVAICLVAATQLNKAESFRLVTSLLFVSTLGIALLVWFGFELFAARLNTLTDSDTYREDGRWQLWQSALTTWMRFPVLGSGGETYRYWETILQPSNATNTSGSLAYRSDNEFLDVAAEYGIFAVAILLGVTCLILRQGFKLARKNPLAAGAFMGMVAVSVHSCLDFGLRVPATAVFATAVVALICNLSLTSPSDAPRRNALGSVSIGICCIAAGLLLVVSLKKSDLAERWRQVAYSEFRDQKYAECVSSMLHSVESEPDNVEGRIEASRTMLAIARMTQDEDLRKDRMRLALGNLLVARSLCPLAWEPHFWLAVHCDQIAVNPGQQAYLKNARFLHPGNADIAFHYGESLNSAGKFPEAWQQWLASLSISLKHLAEIIELSRRNATLDEFCNHVLPKDPKLYLQIAKSFQDRDQFEHEVPQLLQRALDIIAEDYPDSQFEIAAECQLMLGQPLKAIESLAAALQQQTDSVELRLKLARLQIGESRIEDARKTLRRLLVYQPENAAALALLSQLDKS